MAPEPPLSLDPEEFRVWAHRVVDWIADYRLRAPDLPVKSSVEPGWMLARLPSEPPREPQGFGRVMEDLEAHILPALGHWQHPRFFGYFPSNGDLAAVLGDFLSTGLGVLGLNWAAAPALTELEERATDWLRQMLGLPKEFSGVIQDTASSSSLVALICARERSSGHGALRGGLQTGQTPLVVYVSDQAHSSVDKAALLAGFGRDFVRRIPVDAAFAMDPAALEQAIVADRAQGLRPCAIVATSGTTTTTAMDPIAASADIAARHDLWLHVDAAMAGSAMLLPECRALWAGIERADSIVVNPHKWLGVSFDCSVYYVRDSEHLVRVMSTNPSYLATSQDGAVKNYRDWGLPLGRRFRALKLWSLIQTHGVARLEARLRRDLEHARWLAEQVRAAPEWRLLAPVLLQTLCLRHEPPGLSGPALDRHTLAWVERLHATGRAWVTPAQLEGRWMVRVSIGALGTEREHVQQLWDDLRSVVQG